jgi:hypothetical protein
VKNAMNKSRGDTSELSPGLDQLAFGIGKFIQYWGFKEIHGRIWTLLYLSPEPLSAVDLSRKLRVSKTLLSFSIAELLRYDVIVEAGKGTKRTLFFRANPQITSVIVRVLISREKPLMEALGHAFAGMDPADRQIDLSQLKKLGRLIHSAQAVLHGLIVSGSAGLELVDRLSRVATALKKHK